MYLYAAFFVYKTDFSVYERLCSTMHFSKINAFCSLEHQDVDCQLHGFTPKISPPHFIFDSVTVFSVQNIHFK